MLQKIRQKVVTLKWKGYYPFSEFYEDFKILFRSSVYILPGWYYI